MGVLGVVVLVFHVLVAAGICGLVLLQHGKGADMGAAFGSGTSGSLFGASGSANFLSRSTAVLAGLFFITSLGLTWYMGHRNAPTSVMDTHKAQPAVPSPAPTAPGSASGAGSASAPPASAPAAPNSVPAPSSQGTPAGSKAGDIPK